MMRRGWRLAARTAWGMGVKASATLYPHPAIAWQPGGRPPEGHTHGKKGGRGGGRTDGTTPRTINTVPQQRDGDRGAAPRGVTHTLRAGEGGGPGRGRGTVEE